MVHDYVKTFESGPSRVRKCSLPCDAVHYGAILKGLQETGLWFQKPDEIRRSIHDLIKCLKRGDDAVFRVQQDFKMHETHYACHLRGYLVSRAAEILSDLQHPALESHLDYMDTVSSELGLSE